MCEQEPKIYSGSDLLSSVYMPIHVASSYVKLQP